MNLRNFTEEGLDYVNIQIVNDFTVEKRRIKSLNDNIHIISKAETNETTRLAPIKLKEEEFRRVLSYQKRMLNYARKLYKESIGTSKEENMRKMYNDAIEDYKTFVTLHKFE